MLLALTLTLAVRQNTTPTMSMGARPEFHEVVSAIEQGLSKGDFESAKVALTLLPKGNFVMGWDDTALPADMRSSVVLARDVAIRGWQRINGLAVRVAPTGDLNIRFVDVLPDGTQNIPMEERFKFGQNPRLSVEIGTHRGKPTQAIITPDFAQAIGRAIGAYLGVADDPIPGNVMYANDRPAIRVGGPTIPQLYTASENLKTGLQLQALVDKRETIALAEPSATLSPTRGDMGSVLQGTRAPLEFKVSNGGTAPLRYHLVPDCGCFSHVPPGIVDPGKTATLRTLVNTQEYTGSISKLLVLYTNDPKNPAIQIPVSFKARPAYRFFRPEGDKVVVPDGGTAVDVFLFTPKDSSIMPNRYEWDGIEGKVTMEKWHGMLPDPEMDEPAMPRDGYKFHIKLSGNLIPGRTPGTLMIETGDPTFGEIRYNLYAQKGIIALPESLILGDIVGIGRASFEISRPGKPFRILGVTSGSASLKATVTPGSTKDFYRVDVICDSNAPKGDFSSWVRLRTDDPKQPSVNVPITGTID